MTFRFQVATNVQNCAKFVDLVKQELEKILKGSKKTSVLKGFGRRIEANFTQMIDQQDFGQGLVPLSVSYEKRKRSSGQESKLLVSTGGYSRSLKSRIVNKDELEIFFSGVNPVSGASYEEIAYMLNNGTSKMPARPHWPQFVEKVEKDFRYLVYTLVDASMRRAESVSTGASEDVE